MSEQDSGSDRMGASDEPDAVEAGAVSPTGNGAAAPTARTSVSFRDPHGGAAVRVGRVARTILNLLAVLVRLVAGLFAVVLLVRIGLAFTAVNQHNAIVEGIVKFADAIVLDFRDLFLPASPRTALVVNYGLAAVFWLAVGLIIAWALSSLGRLAARRS